MSSKPEKIDKDIKEALIKRAYGYEYEDKEVIADSTGRAEKVKITKRHVPPDLKALKRIDFLQRTGRWDG